MNRRLAHLVMASGLALASAAIGQDLKISSITLYRSGVASFERTGVIDGNAKVQLRFATDQINDILKSMVLLDLDGGAIAGVGYASREPLEQRLGSFAIDLSDNPSVGELVSRLRGSRVRVTTPEGPIEGTVLNREVRAVGVNDKGEQIMVPFVSLITPKGIRSLNVYDALGVEVLDEELAKELNKALEAIAEHRAERFKTVDIALAGQGARRIVAAYIHETPVWKTAYRLVLPEAGTKGDAGLPTIHGWAIVENTTDEDWNDVRLSLVSGRPVSFQMDLYEPLLAWRPEVPVPTEPGVAPRVYAEGESPSIFLGRELSKAAEHGQPPAASPAVASDERRRGRPGAGGGLTALRDAAPGDPSGGDSDKGFGTTGNMGYMAEAQAQAAEVGEVFQYQLKTPVTVERQRSAMLPILTSPIEGRRVSIYNANDLAAHPLRGVELKNTSGLQLMPGPVTVYDTSAYAGDAQIGHLSKGDKRLLAYSVDLDVDASSTESASGELRRVKVVSGLLEQTTLRRTTRTYQFNNKDQARPRTILVEHPRLAEWDLVEPAKPAEQTEALYRFEVVLDPGKAGSLKVTQQRIFSQGYQLWQYDMGTLLQIVRDGKASQAVVDAVKKAAEIQAEISTLERRIGDLNAERATIDQDQVRLRENIKAIDAKSELSSRYMQKLSQQETRLEQIKTQVEEAQVKLRAAQERLATFVKDLNVE